MIQLMVKYTGKMTRINITVPEDLLEDFKKYCEEQCRPVSAQIQFMMKEILSSQESPEKSKISSSQGNK